MNIKTIEEKAKAYDEALEKATTYYDNAKVAGDYSAVARYENIFPELAESEDERRLINTSISFLKDFADKGYENAVECIDWLKSKLNGNSCK